jgi:hypothetical protein
MGKKLSKAKNCVARYVNGKSEDTTDSNMILDGIVDSIVEGMIGRRASS